MNPSEDLVGIGSSLMKGDVLKLYYLMILTGTSPAAANKFLFNLRFSDQRANAVQIRNMLIGSLKQVLMKIVHDPVLYQRARQLANRKDFNVFEDIQTELNKTLDEFSVAGIMKKLTALNKDKDYKKQIATHIINFTEEVQGTAGTQLGVVQGSGTSGISAGIDSYDLPLGAKRRKDKTMIQKRSKMVGNPLFGLTAEGYSLAINGTLPTEINEALKETGIVVLENVENESMMFLVAEPEDQETLSEENIDAVINDQRPSADDPNVRRYWSDKFNKEKAKKLDPVGEEDDDVDNDGDVDDSDKYLEHRRAAVKSAINMKKSKKSK